MESKLLRQACKEISHQGDDKTVLKRLVAYNGQVARILCISNIFIMDVCSIHLTLLYSTEYGRQVVH